MAKVKVESITINRSPFFDSGSYCYTVSINGDEIFGLPMGADEAVDCVKFVIDLVEEHDGYYDPEWQE